MYVTVWADRIGVTVASDVRDKDDKPTYGVFITPGGPIVLDSTTPPSERRRVLVHEISEAVSAFVGELAPGDTEGAHNRTARIESQLAADLTAQGGPEVIDALFGDNSAKDKLVSDTGATYVPHYQDNADFPIRVACGYCRREHYPPTAVSSGEPAFDPTSGGHVMNRVLVCGACERQTSWVQACTPDGTPLPLIIGRPLVRDTRRLVEA